MPQSCSLCRHPNRVDIDQKLLAKTPLRNIAEHFGTSAAALSRHREHIVRSLAKAHTAREIAHADSVLADVRVQHGRGERLYEAAETILSQALEARDLRTALSAVKSAVDVLSAARGYLELPAELTGELAKEHGTELTDDELERQLLAKLTSLFAAPGPCDSVIDVRHETS